MGGVWGEVCGGTRGGWGLREGVGGGGWTRLNATLWIPSSVHV
eukprot:COSAG06_NODE_13728_length_1225_cov_0.627886_2_plen_42_part_01